MIVIHLIVLFRKERKVFETYQKQLLAKPNRKERQEIEVLRDEVRTHMICTYELKVFFF